MDITVDSDGEIDDGAYGHLPLEWSSSTLWNAKEMRLLKEQHKEEKLLEVIHSETLIAAKPLQNRLIEQISIDDEQDGELETLEDLLEENECEFDTDLEKVEGCKSLMGHIKHAAKAAMRRKKVGKGIEKGVKKVAHVGKKMVHGAVGFVKDHKKECLIVDGVLLGAAAGVAIAGALSSNDARKEEEDESPKAKAIDAPPSGPAPPIADTLYSAGETPIAPCALPPTAPSAPETPFKSVIATFIETLRYGLETIGRGMSELDLLDPNSPLTSLQDNRDKQTAAPSAAADSPASLSLGQSIANISELETIGRGLSESDRLDPLSSTAPFYSDGKDNQVQAATDLNIPHPSQNLPPLVLAPLKSAYAYFAEILNSSPVSASSGLVFPELARLLKPERSEYYSTQGISQDSMCISFINGMNNSFEDATHSAEYLRSLGSNLRIDGIYNHSNGSLNDLLETFFCNYKGYSPVTQDLLVQKWSDFHEKNKDNPFAKCLHICHSQGAIHTKNALMNLPEEIRNRVIVVAIAPAIVVSDELCYRSFNYASKNDIVHYGEDLVKQSLANSNESDRMELLKSLAQSKEQLILLEAHENATGFDHNFQSPTYENMLIYRLKDYAEHKGEYK